MDTASYHEKPIVEKRNQTYVFLTMSDLKKYFASTIDKNDMNRIIANAKKSFIKRQGVSSEETQLQFINKCEVEILKLVHSTP